MRPRDLPSDCAGFDWDEGNVDKNWERHRVAFWEAEEPFFNRPLVLRSDPGHSRAEPRFWAVGQTDAGRLLFISFTTRRSLIRVISARDMTLREVRAYAKSKD